MFAFFFMNFDGFEVCLACAKEIGVDEVIFHKRCVNFRHVCICLYICVCVCVCGVCLCGLMRAWPASYRRHLRRSANFFALSSRTFVSKIKRCMSQRCACRSKAAHGSLKPRVVWAVLRHAWTTVENLRPCLQHTRLWEMVAIMRLWHEHEIVELLQGLALLFPLPKPQENIRTLQAPVPNFWIKNVSQGPTFHKIFEN